MPGSPISDPTSVVAEGFAALADLTRDPSLVTGGEAIHRSVATALAAELRDGDRATIATPCIRMEGQRPSLLIVLDDRAVLAWTTGVLRPTPHAEALPLDESWGATVAPGKGARQPVKVLTVQWAESDPWVVAVPDRPELTRFLRECFRARSSTL